jgi:hypothetical protein
MSESEMCERGCLCRLGCQKQGMPGSVKAHTVGFVVQSKQGVGMGAHDTVVKGFALGHG